MKTSRVLSAISFGLIIATPACSARFASIGNDIDAGQGGNSSSVGGGSAMRNVGGSTGVTCIYENVTYAPGASFKSTDGCNTCSCTSSGEVGCTLLFCSATGGSSGVGGSTGSTCTCSGPEPEAPTVKCWDGSTAGPTCATHTDGTCNWTVTTCPIQPGVGGSTGAGGSTSVTCLYNGVNYPAGTIPANTCCTCSADGSIACANNTACNNQGTGGSSGVGGATGTSGCVTAADCKGALPALCELCTDGSDGCAHFTCKSGSCEIAYCENASCIYNGVDYASGSSFTASDGCNKCSCGTTGKVVCTTLPCPLSGTGGASSVGGAGQGGATSCPAIPLVIPKCDNGTAILKYDSTGCPTGYVCPTCPTFNLPDITCSNYQIVTDPTTGCATGYTCPNSDASVCSPVPLAMPVCPNSSAVLNYDASTGCATGYACP